MNRFSAGFLLRWEGAASLQVNFLKFFKTWKRRSFSDNIACNFAKFSIHYAHDVDPCLPLRVISGALASILLMSSERSIALHLNFRSILPGVANRSCFHDLKTAFRSCWYRTSFTDWWLASAILFSQEKNRWLGLMFQKSFVFLSDLPAVAVLSCSQCGIFHTRSSVFTTYGFCCSDKRYFGKLMLIRN